MTPELRQNYLLWLYQNPSTHQVDVLGEALGLSKSESAAVARYLVAEDLAQGEVWELLDNTWDGFLEIAPKGMKVIENNVPHNELHRPITNKTVVHGNNSGMINNSTATGSASIKIEASVEQAPLDLFRQLAEQVSSHIQDETSRQVLMAKVNELQKAYESNRKSSFVEKYKEFVGLASSHIELFCALAPTAIPALHALASNIS